MGSRIYFFDIGLQDSGEITDAIQTFRLFFEESDLFNHLQNIGQTNFLFVRKDKKSSKFITSSTWKDELLQEWLFNSVREHEKLEGGFNQKIAEISTLNESLKAENRKLFDELIKAADFQNDLLQTIKERDEELRKK
ncbi:MAG: hypothetical protein WDO19_10010 [Bacteroidota bacterium]